ncbi:MAG: hypothetical protein ACOX5Q_07935 [Bacillota bacterium]|jgi:hypothetical protein|nr:hypothetical protein [Candidatus Fermentithermobacillaceae bacterium]
MSVDKRSVSAREYEDTLKRIRDVVTARAVLGPDGSIEEIHVLAGPGRPVKFIARDVESSLIAAFGHPIDRRKVSIAQLGGDPGRQEKRVQLRKVEIVSEADTAEVNVYLKMGNNEVMGSAEGVPTAKNWLWLSACAAINAIGQYLASDISFAVEDVSVTTSRSTRIALVSVRLFASGKELLLTGSCPISHDDREAVVKATLDAVNRKFAQMLEGDT